MSYLWVIVPEKALIVLKWNQRDFTSSGVKTPLQVVRENDSISSLVRVQVIVFSSPDFVIIVFPIAIKEVNETAVYNVVMHCISHNNWSDGQEKPFPPPIIEYWNMLFLSVGIILGCLYSCNALCAYTKTSRSSTILRMSSSLVDSAKTNIPRRIKRTLRSVKDASTFSSTILTPEVDGDYSFRPELLEWNLSIAWFL